MRVLQCIDSLNPAHGGTVESTIQMSRAMIQCGASVEILTLDAPGQHQTGDSSCSIHRLGPSYTYYRYSQRLQPWLRENLGRYDTVIVNGIWRYHSAGVWWAARRANVPYFLIVHSMLNPWFRRAFPGKHIKKAAYWLAAERHTLQDARAVIYVSEEERRLAHGAFWPYRCREAVLPYGTADPMAASQSTPELALREYPVLRGKRVILFLGRLQPQKACDIAVRAFSHVAHQSPDLHLVMAGPDPAGWRVELEALAADLGISRKITWTGPVAGDMKWSLFKASELFLLPSHCESLCYALVEALACEVPAVITRRVNSYREIQNYNCALIGEDTLEDTVKSLRQWLEMPEETRAEMRANARRCFVSEFDSKVGARRLLDYFAQNL